MALGEQFRSSAGFRRATEPRRSVFESIETALFPLTPVPISDGLARSVEFRRKTGTWLCFPYHTMTAIEYTPHSRIDVTFGEKCVSVRGRNLESIYRGVLQQRLHTIVEADRADSLEAAETQPAIDSIVLEARRRSYSHPTLDAPAS